MSDLSDQLPTREDLQKLSRRGMVCYAVRCAMRVVHLTQSDPDLHKKSLACIQVATQYCLASGSVASAANFANDVRAAVAANFANDVRARLIIVHATITSGYAAEATYVSATADADFAHARTALYAAEGAFAAVFTRYPATRSAAYADYFKLLILTSHQAGKEGDPIDPSEDGPLGPLLPVEEKNEKQEISNTDTVEDSPPEKVIMANFKKTDGNHPIIFLSHCSANKQYGHALRDFICGLGVRDQQLVYTSHERHKIPNQASIPQYLREKFDQNIFVIFLWSEEYLNSPACLNEMGAAWVTQSDYLHFYVPDFGFSNPKYQSCFVDKDKMGIVLNGDRQCKIRMLDFKNKILTMFELESNEVTTISLLEEFIAQINDILNHSTQNTPSVTPTEATEQIKEPKFLSAKKLKQYKYPGM